MLTHCPQAWGERFDYWQGNIETKNKIVLVTGSDTPTSIYALKGEPQKKKK